MNSHLDNEQIDRLVTDVLKILEERQNRPLCTYRVQLRGDSFTFRDAARIVPYLRDLGVSHLYCSPYLKARSGSVHGYDIVDHRCLNPELGTEDDYRALIDALRDAGLRHILDIVPNHMGIAGGENVWWQDVLENGPSSPYASYFDIDWRPAKSELHNKVLLPFLGEQYGQVLEQGHLQLEFEDGAFWLRCYDARLPIEPKSYATILSRVTQLMRESPNVEPEAIQETESIITACEYLPETNEISPDRIRERQREKEIIKSRLERLTFDEPAVAALIQQTLQRFNGDPAHPESFDDLDELLDRQVYRLAHWKAASDEINYRRFFDINELASLCVEDPEVFEATHGLVMELLVRGDLDGVRVDHVDGLLDPAEYLRRLQRGYVCRLGRRLFEADRESQNIPDRLSTVSRERWKNAGETLTAPANSTVLMDEPHHDPWTDVEPHFLRRLKERLSSTDGAIRPVIAPPPATDDVVISAPQDRPPQPLYVVVEKILERDEAIPADWPVAGTTGYGFLNRTTELLIDAAGYREITRAYRRFSGITSSYEDLLYDSKRLILRVAMAAELQLLAARLNRLSERHRRTRDFTLNNLRDALREILACFPVYRTYITHKGVSERDRRFVDIAISRARRKNPALDVGLFRFIRGMLLFEPIDGVDERHELDQEMFVGRFQQASSPVMAKGTEDTTFYRYFPLCSLNEVGGSPAPTDFGIDQFHEENRKRRTNRPDSLITTTTHDTKRTEDTRARITVLSHIPGEWRRAVSRWARMNRPRIRQLDNGPAPSRNDEYLFYETLVGIWPTDAIDEPQRKDLIERMQQYMAKATHEAKVHTSWINPNTEYDDAVRDFVAELLTPHARNRFLPDFEHFCEQILDSGLYTALAQVFLKLMSPGVPDIYQGQELWDFSLVDPDNRRPVDYELRQKLLNEIRSAAGDDAETRAEFVRMLGHTPRDPRLKLFVTWRTLQFRRRCARLFDDGEYLPLNVEGPHADHVCAFAWRDRSEERSDDPTLAIAVVPRLTAQLTTFDEEGRPLPPFGRAVWGETAVSLEGIGPLALFDVFRGTWHPEGSDRLEVAEILSEFPLALLSNSPDEPND